MRRARRWSVRWRPLRRPPARPGPEWCGSRRRQHRRQGCVARRRRHELVELLVELRRAHRGKSAQTSDVSSRRARRASSSVIRVAAMRGGGRLEDPPDLHELEGEAVLHEVGGGADAGEQELGSQAGDVGAVASPDVEHPSGDQGTDRLAHGVAAGAQQTRRARPPAAAAGPGTSWPVAMRWRTCWIAASVSGAAIVPLLGRIMRARHRMSEGVRYADSTKRHTSAAAIGGSVTVRGTQR